MQSKSILLKDQTSKNCIRGYEAPDHKGLDSGVAKRRASKAGIRVWRNAQPQRPACGGGETLSFKGLHAGGRKIKKQRLFLIERDRRYPLGTSFVGQCRIFRTFTVYLTSSTCAGCNTCMLNTYALPLLLPAPYVPVVPSLCSLFAAIALCLLKSVTPLTSLRMCYILHVLNTLIPLMFSAFALEACSCISEHIAGTNVITIS